LIEKLDKLNNAVTVSGVPRGAERVGRSGRNFRRGGIFGKKWSHLRKNGKNGKIYCKNGQKS